MNRTITGLVAGITTAVIATPLAAHATEHHKVDVPAWVVTPCGKSRVVNCRVEGQHPHSIRELPGPAHLTCLFYASKSYARHHDYCD